MSTLSNGRTYTVYGEKVRELRKAKPWTRKYRAAVSHCSERTIAKIEKVPPRQQVFAATLRLLAKALGLKEEEIRLLVFEDTGESGKALAGERTKAILKLPQRLDEFDQTELSTIVSSALKLAGLKGGLEIVTIREGCVELEIELGSEDAKRLIVAFETSALADLEVLSIRVETENKNPITKTAKKTSFRPKRKTALAPKIAKQLAKATQLAAFANTYRIKLVALLVDKGCNPNTAEELAQETIFHFFARSKSYVLSKGSIEGYLNAIAARVIKTYHGRLKHERKGEIPLSTPPTDESEKSDRIEALLTLIGDLPGLSSMVLGYIIFQGWTIREVASQLNVSELKVTAELSTGMKMLRKLLQEHGLDMAE